MMSRFLRIAVTVVWFLVWPVVWIYHLAGGDSELVLAAAVILLGFVLNRRSVSWLEKPRSFFARLARRKKLAVLFAGTWVLLLRAALLPVLPVPVPRIPDEFSFLLAGETFASGRLSNPGHPKWIHFETVYTNFWPHYVSKYPPAQGMFLAVGTILGCPWIGVWLSVGVMCAALCWMLQAWLPPGWALFGALLAGARLGIHSYWMNSYYGGAVAAIGGALAFGAYRRLDRRLNVGDALLFAVGIIILANSRPYEGLFTSLPLLVGVLLNLWKNYRRRLRVWLTDFAVPASAILVLGLAWIGFYNWRTTSDPATFPYLENHRRYAIGPLFPWQSVDLDREYNNTIVRDVYVNVGLYHYNNIATPKAFLMTRFREYLDEWHLYLGPLMLVPMVMLPWVVFDRRIRFLLCCFVVVMAGSTVAISFQAHYWASLTGVVWVFLVQCLRHLWVAGGKGRSPGRAMVVLLPWMALVSIGWSSAYGTCGWPAAKAARPAEPWWSCFPGWHWCLSAGGKSNERMRLPRILFIATNSAVSFPIGSNHSINGF